MAVPSALLYAAWTAGAVRVHAAAAGTVSEPFPCSPDERYDIRLTPRPGGAWLRTPLAPRSPFAAASSGGGGLEPCEPIPGTGSIPPTAAGADAAGGLWAIGGKQLYALAPRGGSWRSPQLPNGFQARGAGHGPDRAVWIAGSRPARRLRGSEREAALLHWPPGARTPDPVELRLRPLDAWRAIRHGGLERIDSVEATAEPVTLTSASVDLVDDPWEFVFTRTTGAWRTTAQRGSVIRAVLRTEGGRAIVTSDGQVLALDRLGSTRTLVGREELSAAIGGPGQLMIRGADASGSMLALAIGTFEPEREGLRWLQTAVAIVELGRGRPEVVERRSARDGEGELLDVALTS